MADDLPNETPLAEHEKDGELNLAPLPPNRSEKSDDVERLPPREPDVFGPRQSADSQFSLRQFLAWMLLISIGFAGLAWIRADLFAGICGILTLLLLPIAAIARRMKSFWDPISYAFLTMYLIAMVIAIFALRHRAH